MNCVRLPHQPLHRINIQSLCDLAKRYESATRVSERELSAAIDVGMSELNRRSEILSVSIAKSPLLARVRKWCGKLLATEQPEKEFNDIANLDQAVKNEAGR